MSRIFARSRTPEEEFAKPGAGGSLVHVRSWLRSLFFLALGAQKKTIKRRFYMKSAYCKLGYSSRPHPWEVGVPTAPQDAGPAAAVRFYSPPDVLDWSGFGETRSYAQVRRGVVLCGGAFHDAAFITRVNGCDVVRLCDWELRMRKVKLNKPLVSKLAQPQRSITRKNSKFC